MSQTIEIQGRPWQAHELEEIRQWVQQRQGWSRYRLSRGPIVVGVALVAAGPRPPWTMATLTLGQIRQQDVRGFCAVRRSRVTALATERAVHFVAEAGPFKPPRLEGRLCYFGQCIVRDPQNVAEAALFPERDLQGRDLRIFACGVLHDLRVDRCRRRVRNALQDGLVEFQFVGVAAGAVVGKLDRNHVGAANRVHRCARPQRRQSFTVLSRCVR